jgi:hypothetical protein
VLLRGAKFKNSFAGFHKSRMGVLLGPAGLQDRSTLGCVGGV